MKKSKLRTIAFYYIMRLFQRYTFVFCYMLTKLNLYYSNITCKHYNYTCWAKYYNDYWDDEWMSGKKVWEITFDLRYSFEKIKLWIEERRLTNSEDETRGTRQTSYKGISRKQKLAESFDFTFRYMDDVLSLKNSKVGDFFWSHLSNWI